MSLEPESLLVLIVFYISGHGFGHASRDVELVNAIAASRPDVRIVARTTIPAWMFARARHPVDIQTVETDTGLVQIDSLRFDERESARRAAAFYRTFDERVDAEARVLRTLGADLVVGDIPPLAFAAAARAGVRSMAIGNFTWDWIYSVYPAFEELAPDVIPTIRAAYATATRALRLPFHGGFEPMAAVTDRHPAHRPPIASRSGGHAAAARCRPATARWCSPRSAPMARRFRTRASGPRGDLTLLTVERDPPQGLDYPDLVAAADVVVSKPGYGIVSECIANGTALLYTSRGRFIEYDLFVAEMPRVLRCREISQEDLFAGRWTDAIAALLAQPEPAERPRVDGAEVAAAEVLKSCALIGMLYCARCSPAERPRQQQSLPRLARAADILAAVLILIGTIAMFTPGMELELGSVRSVDPLGVASVPVGRAGRAASATGSFRIRQLSTGS